MANFSYEQLKDIFTELTFLIKGLDYNSSNREVQKLVRRAYEQESQPFNNLSDDTTYVWLTTRDDPTNEIFGESHKLVTEMNPEGETINQQIEITRSQNKVLEVQWVFYGEVAFDSAQIFRMKLFDDTTYRFLKDRGIYLRRQVGAPRNTFEDIANRNWMRSDLEASFNVSISAVEKINVIEEIGINLADLEQEVVIVVN